MCCVGKGGRGCPGSGGRRLARSCGGGLPRRLYVDSYLGEARHRMPYYDLKIVTLGAADVGKTCLVDRYLHGRFDGTSRPTVGAAFGAKTVHRASAVVTVGIWDTAGQERFESISKLYYRGAKAALVCFDLTNKTSFDKVKFWVDELKAYAPECLIFLVGTKADLVEAGVEREVSEAELNAISQEAGAMAVKHTSSKTGANIDELFDAVVTEVTDRFQGNTQL